MDESKSTGERLLTGYFDRFSIEHLHRYAIALDVSRGRDVLDIASGEGYGSSLLSETAKSVVGVDIDQDIVQHARKKYRASNLEFKCGSADMIPLPDASVDVVVSFETLEHHDKHEEMYSEIKRVLRSEGTLIISTPDKQFFSDETGHRNAYHVKELYRNEFMELNSKYFKATHYLSQKFALGSMLFDERAQGAIRFITGDHRRLLVAPRMEAPVYHVCIASDGALERVGGSFFEAAELLSEMDSDLRRQNAELDRLRRRIATLGRQVQDIQTSLSFRLGRALLTPLRLLFPHRK